MEPPWIISTADSRARQNTYQNGLSSKSSLSPCVSTPCTMRAHFRQSPPGLWGSVCWQQIPTWRGSRNRKRWKRHVSVQYQWRENVPIKENNSVPLTRTLCDSTQPVACIRGYEPSGASYRDSEPDCRLFQATFQANTKTTAMHAYLQSLLRQCNGIIVTSNII